MAAERSTAGRENGKRHRPRGYAPWKPQARTRALLDDVKRVLDAYRKYLPLTLRQIFYVLVGAEKLEKTEHAYARLCEHLNRARRARLIRFDVIRDDGVSVVERITYDGIADFEDETARRANDYRRNLQAGQPYAIELWCEAGGMIYQLDDVAARYSVPVYSAGGFVGMSITKELANKALSRDVPTVALHVGDYDPSGVSIFEAMMQDAAAFVREDRTIQTLELIPVRVALTGKQVDRHHLPIAPPKPSDSRSKSWSGGTCQAEALPPNLLAMYVEVAIRRWMDKGILEDTKQAEAEDRAELLGLPAGDDEGDRGG